MLQVIPKRRGGGEGASPGWVTWSPFVVADDETTNDQQARLISLKRGINRAPIHSGVCLQAKQKKKKSPLGSECPLPPCCISYLSVEQRPLLRRQPSSLAPTILSADAPTTTLTLSVPRGRRLSLLWLRIATLHGSGNTKAAQSRSPSCRSPMARCVEVSTDSSGRQPSFCGWKATPNFRSSTSKRAEKSGKSCPGPLYQRYQT
ncbi:hypothetical protein B0T16DRAFT_52841 [Cercophora newfieldiana]|uniref:Uncharacterized protein n=1 Tax=Cercophora newfieldiana TaxID=92897 RepID=A0AA40D1U5_9PEZI|nr:hypothetical protein B0T16DRAFT_52841 [Cercophora newfieldiana]